MNLVDLVALLLLVGAIAAGIRTGAVPQLTGIAGAVGGFLLSVSIAPLLLPAVAGLDPLPRALVVLGVILGLVGLGEATGSALGHALARGLGRGVLSAMDRAAGAVVGAAQAALVIWLAGGLLAAGPIPSLATAAHTSVAVRTVSGYLPAPTDVAGEIAGVLDASGLPEVFVGLEPVPLAPVDRPADPVANAIGRRAEASTLRVSALACGASLTGTGFVVGRGYVATAAHVVAGASGIRVVTHDGPLDATLVLLDPSLDVAVLHVPDLAAPALAFPGRDPGRGALGAALGYAGGGPLTIVPAAVAGTYPATGRNIYGRSRITRQIVELRAAVERGDSGGPFVLQDGTVGGLVFAESRSDPDVGYALAASEAAPVIDQGIGRTAPADPGACLR